MKILTKICVPIVLVVATLTLTLGAKSSVVQRLDQGESKAVFTLDSPLLPVKGSFEGITGTLEMVRGSKIPSSVRVAIDLNKAKVNSTNPQAALVFAQLLANLPSPKVTFQSTKVVAKGDNRLEVTGFVLEGPKDKEVRFPVTIVEMSDARTRFSGKVAGTPKLSDEGSSNFLSPFVNQMSGEASFMLEFASAPPLAKAEVLGQSTSMKKVEVYTIKPCPYCDKAKALLSQEGIPFEATLIDRDDDNARQALMARSQMRTFPQIFVDGKILGGYSDLAAEFEKNKLDWIKS